jgi:hypothetical protein
MTENTTIKQIENADANTIQLQDYTNTDGTNYFTNFNGNTKIYDDTTKTFGGTIRVIDRGIDKQWMTTQ